MMIEVYNVRIRAGNTGTVANALGLVAQILVADMPVNLTGQTIVFRVIDEVGAQILRKDTSTGITVDIPSATITVPITVAESRALAEAPLRLRYEMEQRATGMQRTFLQGDVFIEPGVNDD
jgi:hypothetical protein